jgi:predicted flavoprotein YhiN
MAAITAAEAGATDVWVLEATAEPLNKVRISGGGRCNVTHACWDPRALVGHYPRGGAALRGPFSRFASGDAVAWFDAHGLELVEESDGRMFPRANRSSAVIAVTSSAARSASDSGSEAPSRRESAEWQWSSTYWFGMRDRI